MHIGEPVRILTVEPIVDPVPEKDFPDRGADRRPVPPRCTPPSGAARPPEPTVATGHAGT